MERPAACETKGAVLSYDLTRLPNETDDAQMDQTGDKRSNQERASGHLIWNDRKQNKTKQRTHVHFRISRRGPPLRTRLSILVPQTFHAAWTESTTASGIIGFRKGVWTSSCFHSRVSFSFLQCLPIMYAGDVSSVPGLYARRRLRHKGRIASPFPSSWFTRWHIMLTTQPPV